MNQEGVAYGAELPSPPRERSVQVRRSQITLERCDFSSRLKREGPLLFLVLAVFGVSLALPALKSRNLWFNFPCLFRTITGVPCLACGLTRSFVFTAHGDFASAFEMHLLGPILFIILAGIGFYLAISLTSGYRVRFKLARRTRRVAAWSVLSVFLICWFIKLVFMRGSW